MNSTRPPAMTPFKSAAKPQYRWRVRWTESGKRRDRLFRSKGEASNFFNLKRVEVANLGHKYAASLSDDLRREAVECKRRLEVYGASLSDAVDLFVRHAEASAKSKPVSELVAELLEHAKAQGKRTATVAELRFRLNRFSDDFGDRLASDITGRDVSQWLHGIRGGMQSKNNFRRTCSTFFNWCKGQGFVEANPVEGVRPFKVEKGDTEVFTPQEMVIILREAGKAGDDILAAVLLGGFAGLRSSEIHRFDWEKLKLKRGFIDLSAGKTKTAQRRLVEIREPLRTWLAERFAFATGPLRGPNFKRRETAFHNHLGRNCGLAWKDNGLRHSFGSYLLAAISDAGKVAHEMGHASTERLYKNYREVVEPEAAAEFWSLTPDRVEKNVISMTG